METQKPSKGFGNIISDMVYGRKSHEIPEKEDSLDDSPESAESESVSVSSTGPEKVIKKKKVARAPKKAKIVKKKKVVVEKASSDSEPLFGEEADEDQDASMERPGQPTNIPHASISNIIACGGAERAKRFQLYAPIEAAVKNSIRDLITNSIISMNSQGRTTLSASKDLTFACEKAKIAFFTGEEEDAVSAV